MEKHGKVLKNVLLLLNTYHFFSIKFSIKFRFLSNKDLIDGVRLPS